jgi:hypothetical protein
MRHGSGQDRKARLLQFYNSLPPMQQGVVMCVLLGNALAVVTLDGVIVVAVIRGAVRSWRRRPLSPLTAIRTAIGPTLCVALAGAAIERATVQELMRAVDTGRAAAWLERAERWLTAGDQNKCSRRSSAPEAD